MRALLQGLQLQREAPCFRDALRPAIPYHGTSLYLRLAPAQIQGFGLLRCHAPNQGRPLQRQEGTQCGVSGRTVLVRAHVAVLRKHILNRPRSGLSKSDMGKNLLDASTRKWFPACGLPPSCTDLLGLRIDFLNRFPELAFATSWVPPEGCDVHNGRILERY